MRACSETTLSPKHKHSQFERTERVSILVLVLLVLATASFAQATLTAQSQGAPLTLTLQDALQRARMNDPQYRSAVTDLGKQVVRDAAGIRHMAKQIDDEAQDTARVADMIGAVNVDPDTVAETKELSKIMAGVSEAAIAYATAGDTTAKAAKAAHDQAHASHNGIHEAVNRSGVTGIHQVHRDWFEQQ